MYLIRGQFSSNLIEILLEKYLQYISVPKDMD